MICQDCNKREAHVHLTQIINNEKTSLSLCKECAAARGFHSPLENIPFPLAEILSGMAATPRQRKEVDQETIVCPGCTLTFEEFTRLGRFGCGECYRAFRHRLEPIMRKIHGASLHLGQTPAVSASTTTDDHLPVPVREDQRLEEELKKAIEAEDFERAAEVRDKLKAVRETMSVTNE